MLVEDGRPAVSLVAVRRPRMAMSVMTSEYIVYSHEVGMTVSRKACTRYAIPCTLVAHSCRTRQRSVRQARVTCRRKWRQKRELVLFAGPG